MSQSTTFVEEEERALWRPRAIDEEASFTRDHRFTEAARRLLDDAFYPDEMQQFLPVSGDSRWAKLLQREHGIDCFVVDRNGALQAVDEKIVRPARNGKPFRGMIIETHSNLERTAREGVGDGWIVKSRADLLLYAYGQVDGSLRVWLLNLPQFREWFLKNMGQFPNQDTRNREGYTTRSKVVPLVEIPAGCLLIRDLHVERSRTEVVDWNAVAEEDELDEKLAWDSCRFGYNLGHPSFLPPVDWHGDLLDMVRMGACERCGGVHIKCHWCDTVIAVHETEYGDELRCGCKKGVYQVVRDYDGGEEALEVVEEPGE